MRRIFAGAVAALLVVACQPDAARRGRTVLFASGADLQSINPLVTLHPLARQVQRYVLFTTLVRYDSAMAVQPYLAREWTWNQGRTELELRIHSGVRWDDGVATTAQDARWTLDAAMDSATGYPRRAELADVVRIEAPDDSTLQIGFRQPQPRMPDVLTDLAILPAHLLDTVPRARMREAAFNEQPVGNGPFRFVAHDANRRWVFARSATFSRALGPPARLDRLIIVVVDEPATKLAALTSGELDFAGIQPAHASFVRANPSLRVITYPLFFSYGIVFNTRRPPGDRRAVRRAISASIDRREIVEGYLFGFGSPAYGPLLGDTVSQAGSATLEEPVEIELLTVGSGEAALEQLLQSQLGRVGIHASIRQLELGAFLERVYGPAHDFQAAVMGLPGDITASHLPALLSLTGAGDSLGRTSDVKVRFETDLPVVFLYHARGVQGASRRVRHVRMDLRGELPTVADWDVAE